MGGGGAAAQTSSCGCRRERTQVAAAVCALVSIAALRVALFHGGGGGGAGPSKMPLRAHPTASGRFVRWEPADEADAHVRYHPQRYEPLPTVAEERRRQRRRLVETHELEYEPTAEVLTDETTRGLSIHVDFSSLYPVDAPDRPAGLSPAVPYAVCFAVGNWFKWGQPATDAPPCAEPSLPADRSHAGWVNGAPNPCPGAAGEICDRSRDPTVYSQAGCWGVCVEEDVLDTTTDAACTAAGFGADVCNMREYYMSKVRGVVADFEPFLRVRRRTGLLVLTQDPQQRCAPFAQDSYNLPVGQHYCVTGVEADAIFFPTYTQYVPNVGGWGTEAGKDQFGRPLLILMGLTAKRDYRQRCVAGDSVRKLIMHELVHGLGFEIHHFEHAGGAASCSGNPNCPVARREYTDISGSPDPTTGRMTDEIWVVVAPRVLEKAREFFGCPTLDALPLMGRNQLGDASRDSHWETRIMNDEFMAYGEGGQISAMTLAMMEELGNYKADYSQAECMLWGRNQGCEFVETRCGTRRDDLGVTISAGQSCARTYVTSFGGSETIEQCGETVQMGYAGNSVLMDKCAPPNCGRSWSGECNVECYQGQGTSADLDAGCRTAPPGMVRAATQHAAAVAEGPSIGAATIGGGIGMLGVLAFLGMSVMTVVTEGRGRGGKNLERMLARRYKWLLFAALVQNLLCTLTGLVFLLGSIVALASYPEMQLFFSSASAIVLFATTVAMVGWGLFGVVSVWRARHENGSLTALAVFVVVLIAAVVVQLFLVAALIKWILDAAADAEEQAAGGGVIEELDHQKLRQTACNTYKQCCWEAHEHLGGTACATQHAGMPVGQAAFELNDPSTEGFCTLLTGSDHSMSLPNAVCVSFQEAGIVDLQDCADNFCINGRAGFDDFLSKTENWLRENLLGFTFLALFLILVEVSMCLEHMAIFYVERRRTKLDRNHKDNKGIVRFVLLWLLLPVGNKTKPNDGIEANSAPGGDEDEADDDGISPLQQGGSSGGEQLTFTVTPTESGFGMDLEDDCSISGVKPNGAAECAGVRKGHRILKVDNQMVADKEDIIALLTREDVGTSVVLEMLPQRVSSHNNAAAAAQPTSDDGTEMEEEVTLLEDEGGHEQQGLTAPAARPQLSMFRARAQQVAIAQRLESPVRKLPPPALPGVSIERQQAPPASTSSGASSRMQAESPVQQGAGRDRSNSGSRTPPRKRQSSEAASTTPGSVAAGSGKTPLRGRPPPLQPAAAGASRQATVLHDYDAGGKSGRLSLCKGDAITVSDTTGKDWWVGTAAAGQSGMFPRAYVKLNGSDAATTATSPAVVAPARGPPPPLATSASATATVLFDYDASGKPGRLSLRKGDAVTVADSSSKDWWTGAVDGRIGKFPAKYVQLDSASAVPPPVGAGGGGAEAATTTATALYDYDASGKPGRLSLRKGDVVTVTDSSSKDWWTGAVGGRVGKFPTSYVKLDT